MLADLKQRKKEENPLNKYNYSLEVINNNKSKWSPNNNWIRNKRSLKLGHPLEVNLKYRQMLESAIILSIWIKNQRTINNKSIAR
jgi:hypothetical protein